MRLLGCLPSFFHGHPVYCSEPIGRKACLPLRLRTLLRTAQSVLDHVHRGIPGHHARLPHAHVLLAEASVGQVAMCVLLSLARHASCHRSVIVTSQKMLELVYGTCCWKVSGSGSPNLVTRSVWWFSSTLTEYLKQPRVDLTLMDWRCCETGCRRHAMDERAHDCRWQMISGCEFCVPSLVGRRWSCGLLASYGTLREALSHQFVKTALR